MKHFYLHDAVGKIVSSGTCQDEDFALQAQTSMTLCEGEALYGVDYFDGTVTKPLPACPDSYCRFNYTSKQWEDPRTASTEWVVVRTKRGALLSDTDWVVIKAMEAGSPMPEVWKTYRQALRDVTKQADPFALVWPVMAA